MIKWDLFQICKDGSTLCKLINMKHHIILLFLHGLESNPGSSLQTEEEAGLP